LFYISQHIIYKKIKLSGLFIRPVSINETQFKFYFSKKNFKFVITICLPNKDTRIKNDTKHVDLQQEQVHKYNLSKIFMTVFYDSYSIFIFLSLCCQERLIMSSLLKDGSEGDEKSMLACVELINFVADLAQSPQFLQSFIFDNAKEYFEDKQYLHRDKIANKEVSNVCSYIQQHISINHMKTLPYRAKLWQEKTLANLRIECHSLIFYPTNSIFCKTLNFWIKTLHVHE